MDNSSNGRFTLTEVNILVNYVMNALPSTVALCQRFDGIARSLLLGETFPHITDIEKMASRSADTPHPTWKRSESGVIVEKVAQGFCFRLTIYLDRTSMPSDAMVVRYQLRNGSLFCVTRPRLRLHRLHG
jgi:hypothetical protein